jgi:hypothetical protein
MCAGRMRSANAIISSVTPISKFMRVCSTSLSSNIALLNVPAVFTQVHGDAVGARLFRVQRCLDRVRVAGATGLTQGGDVVDVHAKKNAIAGGHGSAPEGGKIRRTAYQGLRNSSRLTSGRPPK